MPGRNKLVWQPDDREEISLEDGHLLLVPHLNLPVQATVLLRQLISEVEWRSEPIRLFGKSFLQPRLIAFYGDAESPYRYSNRTLMPLPWTPLLAQVKTVVELATGHLFNSVLLNYYRDGRDSMGMHSDDEPELGVNPVIASLSLGQRRNFILKHKTKSHLDSLSIPLGEGDLLVMSGPLQHFWKHGIAKTSQFCGPRVNLTFRFILPICSSSTLPQ